MCKRGPLGKARASWQWNIFLASLARAGQPVLHVNMDETSLKLHVGARPGLVMEACPKKRRRLLRQGGGPPLKMRRSAVTLVAFACDDRRLQKVLPQVFVVNEHVVAKAVVAELSERWPGNLHVLRRKSSWVNSAVAVEVVNSLAASLQDVLRSHLVILHIDAYGAHIQPEFLKACAKVGIIAHLIPASMTPWLQPLDVAVFSKLKGWVVSEVERQRLAAPSGCLSATEMLEIYRRAVQEVLQESDWRSAFLHTGLRGQHGVSGRLLARLGYTSPPEISSNLPSYTDLQVIFPAGRNIPIEELFEAAIAKRKASEALRLPLRARLPPLFELL